MPSSFNDISSTSALCYYLIAKPLSRWKDLDLPFLSRLFSVYIHTHPWLDGLNGVENERTSGCLVPEASALTPCIKVLLL